MDMPGINGLSAALEALNGWFAGWTIDLGSSFLNEWEINGPLVSAVSHAVSLF